MTETPAEVVEATGPPRRRRHWRRTAVVLAVLLLLFGVPWWTLLAAGAALAGSGPRRRHAGVRGGLRRDARPDGAGPWPSASRLGRGSPATPCSARPGCCSCGRCSASCCGSALLDRRGRRSDAVAGGRGGGVGRGAVLLVWGYAEAMRVPRVRTLDVAIDRLGAGLDGLRVVLHHRHPLRPDRPGTVVGRAWSRG